MEWEENYEDYFLWFVVEHRDQAQQRKRLTLKTFNGAISFRTVFIYF